MLVAIDYEFQFYSTDLVRVQDIELIDVVSALNSICQFKHLKYSQSGSFIMIASIDEDNLDKIKANNIQHTYTGTGKDYDNFIMTELSVDENQSPPQIESKNLQDNSLHLKKYNAKDYSLIEIGTQ